MHPHLTIKRITAQQTYPVRHAVLRQGKPIASCAFKGDALHSTLHFGVLYKNAIIGTATILENIHPLFPIDIQHQLRAMGILPDFQKKGIGAILIKTIEDHITTSKKSLIWMHARILAVPFYKKLGYIKHEAPFSISDIGLHYIMAKPLISTAQSKA